MSSKEKRRQSPQHEEIPWTDEDDAAADRAMDKLDKKWRREEARNQSSSRRRPEIPRRRYDT